MSLRGYTPKHKKALWLGVKGLSQNGTQQAPSHRAPKTPQERPGKQYPQVRVWRRKTRCKAFKTPKQARIKPVSDPKAAELAKYRRDARKSVRQARARGDTCPVFALWHKLPWEVQKFLTEPWKPYRRRSNRLKCIHHIFGRAGRLLNWQPGWVPLSTWGHRAVHAFPAVFRELGLLAPAGQWNNQRLVK